MMSIWDEKVTLSNLVGFKFSDEDLIEMITYMEDAEGEHIELLMGIVLGD